MAKVRMYGINNKCIAAHTSNRKEDIRFRKKKAIKNQKAPDQKKGTGGEQCV